MRCLTGSQLADVLNGSASSELAVQIEGHVDQCADCRELLVNLARAVSYSNLRTSRTEPLAPAPLAPAVPGEALPCISRRYRILELLGEGGMGRVYRAQDLLQGTEVALKQVLMPSPLGPSGSTLSGLPEPEEIRGRATHGSPFSARTPLERGLGRNRHIQRTRALADEFRTLASLRHPNIISVLDYGFDSQGQPFYTMELLADAKPLLVFARSQPPAQRIELVFQILHALAYLHRRGILHRDLTPNNVLVVHGSEGPRVKVVDFGLAVGVDGITRSAAAGTLLYMAPELLRGDLASERSDLYAVGVLAYQVLIDRYPFVIERGTQQLLQSILLSAPDLSPLPEAMRPVLGQVLSKAAQERPSDAATLLRQLAAAADRPLGEEPAATRDSYLIAARFIGRHTELGQLQQALDAAKRERSGSSWLVSGVSGVGKSRLLEELRSAALQAGALAVRGQAMPGGGAYHVWQDVLKLLVLQVPLNELEAGALASLLPELPVLLGRAIPAQQALDPQSARLHLFRVIDELLARLPETALLLLEDLQWADSESLALLSYVAGNVPSRSMLIVGSYRVEEAAGLGASFPQMRELPLQRLSRSETEELCTSMLGRIGQNPQLLDRVFTETDGNAFFVVEIMRVLAAEAGSLESVGTRGLPQRIFAGGIEQVLRRQLERAPLAARPLLVHAAVSGRQLDLPLLLHLVPDAEDQIRALADVGLLEISLQRWRFSHDKLREQVLSEMSSIERKTLHESIAAALEQLFPDDASRVAQTAIHYHEAGRLAKAAHFYGVAGEAALRRGAPGEADTLLEQARLLHAQVRGPRLAEVKVWRGLTEARFGLGRLREAESALRKVCELADMPLPAQPLRLVTTTGGLAASLLGTRMGIRRRAPLHDPERRAILTELLAAVGIQEVFVWTDQPELGLLCTLLGLYLEDTLGLLPRRNYHRSALFFILAHTPLRGLCLRYMEHVARRDAAILSGTHAEIDFLRVRALVEISDGRLSIAGEHAARAVQLARSYKDDLALLRSLLQLQLTAAGLEDFPQMLAVSQEMEPLARRAGDPRYLALAYTGQGAALINLGEYSDAALRLEQARAFLPQELGPVPESVTLSLAAVAALQVGQAARAVELADQALAAVGRARWELAQLRHPLVCVLDVYLRLETWRQHTSEIEGALTRLQRLARRFPQAAADEKRFQGIYAWYSGQPYRALSLLRAGIRIAAELGMRSETAMAQYWLGCFAKSPSGRALVPEGAEPHFQAALATFEQLKAAGMIDHIRRARSAPPDVL
ncbi:MAG: AAA family ATPase [Polyangia bacterium]